MSLSSTSNLKGQLIKNLGLNARLYFDSLSSFVSGRTSRTEFEQVTKQVLTSANLLQLHNALIISLFDATATLKRPPSPPPPSLPKPPPSKRRRTLLPYQGPDIPDEQRTIRSGRLKKWALSVGRKERERIRALQTAPTTIEPMRPRREIDEIACERGVELLPERGDPPGSRLPIQLHSSTRAPTLQHVADRVNLISAQNNFATPARPVPAYLTLATEAFLKQLITHAITLSITSSTISSISPTSQNGSSHHFHLPKAQILTAASMNTLFTVSPADLPNKSAAAMRFALSPTSLDSETEDLLLLKDREVRDQRWQIMALLAERSTVRDSLKAKPR
ncbi:transcriptional regulator of RNA polII, SAGA, subunit-domain-containing protein [Crepidotus variabilis]|uniref:Transcriptional regulator of RNA polII, SAGA, subunit-domain-containing protein n=1 Tax=Crepidotus variabilis TaxID=179855 RepID=A0A9P6EAU8_9AGAR|nr:transcriptional regulator of RNA polII, SAGA, subunit-domain-containing protein [Crepidotus variabilis]